MDIEHIIAEQEQEELRQVLQEENEENIQEILDFNEFRGLLTSENSRVVSLTPIYGNDSETEYQVVAVNIYTEHHRYKASTNEYLWLVNHGFIPFHLLENSQLPVISVNPASLQVSEETSRFSGASWFTDIQTTRVLLAGVGGIGSYVGLLLARLHVSKLTIMDPDVVEMGNLSGQLYGKQYIGVQKVVALNNIIHDFANYYGTILYGVRYTHTYINLLEPIVICGFDNMESRKILYEDWKNKANKELFIDGRLSAEELQVIAIQSDDTRAMKEYEDNWLFSDYEAEVTVCSFKQTSHMANMIGSIIANIFVNYIAGKQGGASIRAVPFITTYSAETMYFKVTM